MLPQQLANPSLVTQPTDNSLLPQHISDNRKTFREIHPLDILINSDGGEIIYWSLRSAFGRLVVILRPLVVLREVDAHFDAVRRGYGTVLQGCRIHSLQRVFVLPAAAPSGKIYH